MISLNETSTMYKRRHRNPTVGQVKSSRGNVKNKKQSGLRDKLLQQTCPRRQDVPNSNLRGTCVSSLQPPLGANMEKDFCLRNMLDRESYSIQVGKMKSGRQVKFKTLQTFVDTTACFVKLPHQYERLPCRIRSISFESSECQRLQGWIKWLTGMSNRS